MIDVVVKEKRTEADNICSYLLEKADGGPLPSFEAGSHIDVQLPGEIVRQYSLCGRVDDNTRYQIAVLKELHSRGGSLAMHEHVQKGSRLQISEPRNLFPLQRNAKRSILFAGGIGITPLLTMAETLFHKGADFELHYCAHSRERAAFVDRILASSYAKHCTLHFSKGDPGSRIDAAEILGQAEPDSHIYLCGPLSFIEYLQSTAEALRWLPPQIHREFFSATTVEEEKLDSNFEIEIRSTGQILEVPVGKRVIDVLEENGMMIPVSCEEGICGTCITKVLAGEPEHRDMFMTDEEHARNDCFTPCCSRSKSARLVLDL